MRLVDVGSIPPPWILLKVVGRDCCVEIRVSGGVDGHGVLLVASTERRMSLSDRDRSSWYRLLGSVNVPMSKSNAFDIMN